MTWRGNTFECPPLDDLTRDDLLTQAKSACKYLIVNATTADTFPIYNVVVSDKTGRHATVRLEFRPLTLFTMSQLRKMTDSLEPQLEGACATTRVRATIDEVSDFFYVDTPTKAREFSRVLGENVIDKKTLYSLIDRPVVEASTEPYHYVGIEWTLLKNPGMPLRDMCYLDYHDEFSFVDKVTGDVRRGWARCMHSVDVDGCPDLEQRYGVIRATIVRSGHVFVETAVKGELEYNRVYFANPRGKVLKHFPQYFLNTYLKKYAINVLNLEEHFTTQRIKTMLKAPISQFHMKKSVSHCMICSSRFGWTSSKKQCRGCGCVTCGKCIAVWTVDLDAKTTIKVDLCYKCVSGENDNMTTASDVDSSQEHQSPTDRFSRPHSDPNMLGDHPRQYAPIVAARPSHGRRSVSEGFVDEEPSVIMIQSPSQRGGDNHDEDEDDNESGYRTISPKQWRPSACGSAVAMRDVMLTFRSDNSSLYL
ncbi:unnamed protein product [Aphanomyces euteiches]